MVGKKGRGIRQIMNIKRAKTYSRLLLKKNHCVACSSPNGLLPLPAAAAPTGRLDSLCDALLVASSITALKLVLLKVPVLLEADVFGGSEKGPISDDGESTIIVAAVESLALDSEPMLDADVSSLSREPVVLSFFTLPTRTTIARAGVAVWVLALLRKVEPTLKVLFAGLGGRTEAYFS